MAATKVDPPPFKDQITDGNGNITPEFHDFLYRLWQRTGGDSDILDFIGKLQSNRVYQQQLEPAINGSNAAQLFQALQFRSPFDYQRLENLEKEVESNQGSTIPAGVIVMWSGEEAPAGWAICDGTNGTPDLRERFVIGASETAGFTPGESGGSLNLAFSVTEQPANITINKTTTEVQSGTGATVLSDVSLVDNNHTHGFNGERVPPYYAMAFIMKLSEPAP